MKCLVALLLGVLAGTAQAEKPAPTLQLEPGARVGLLYVLENELTHFHVGFTAFGNLYRKISVDWSIKEYFEKPLLEAIVARGYVGVPVTASDLSLMDRVKTFGSTGIFISGGPTQAALSEYRRLADVEQLRALIVVAPAEFDVISEEGGSFLTKKSWQLPGRVSDWGVATRGKHGKGDSAVFNLSKLLLIDLHGDKPKQISIVLASDATAWQNKDWPEDVRTAPAESFEGARPVLEAMIARQVAKFLPSLAPSAGIESAAPAG